MKKISIIWGMAVTLAIIFSAESRDLCYANQNPRLARESHYFMYENKQLGVVIEIPKRWDGHYLIDTRDPNCILVNFVGVSKTSKWGNSDLADSGEAMGLPLFGIGNEDSIKDAQWIAEITKIKGVAGDDLYYFTGRESPTTILSRIHSDMMGEYDKEEKDLAWDDWLYAIEMEEDLEDIITLLKEQLL